MDDTIIISIVCGACKENSLKGIFIYFGHYNIIGDITSMHVPFMLSNIPMCTLCLDVAEMKRTDQLFQLMAEMDTKKVLYISNLIVLKFKVLKPRWFIEPIQGSNSYLTKIRSQFKGSHKYFIYIDPRALLYLQARDQFSNL
ncbi:hypothetical protein QTP88_004870 [Uroleucon formosanum]